MVIAEVLIPEIGPDLEGLDGTWHRWPHWSVQALVRRLDEDRWIAIAPFLFTWGVLVGRMGRIWSYDARWCYHNFATALAAATVWDGIGEPVGALRQDPDFGWRP